MQPSACWICSTHPCTLISTLSSVSLTQHFPPQILHSYFVRATSGNLLKVGKWGNCWIHLVFSPQFWSITIFHHLAVSIFKIIDSHILPFCIVDFNSANFFLCRYFHTITSLPPPTWNINLFTIRLTEVVPIPWSLEITYLFRKTRMDTVYRCYFCRCVTLYGVPVAALGIQVRHFWWRGPRFYSIFSVGNWLLFLFSPLCLLPWDFFFATWNFQIWNLSY